MAVITIVAPALHARVINTRARLLSVVAAAAISHAARKAGAAVTTLG